VNVISPARPQNPEQRTERHLRICEELIEIAMDLARATGREAAREAAAREAEAQAPQAQPSATTPKPRKPNDAAALFTRLSATIHRFIALEAKLAAGPQARTKQTTLPPADPRRATLRQVFQHVTERNPNRAEIRRQTSARLEEILAEDLNGEIHIGDVFTKICEDLAVDIDLATLPDALLDILCPEEAGEEFSPTLDPAPPFRPSAPAS